MTAPKLTIASAFSLLGRIGGSVATLVATMLLARLLGPADFAAYAVAFIVVQLFSQLGVLGMNDAAVRFVGGHIGAGRSADADRAALRCVGFGLAGLVVMAALFFLVHRPLVGGLQMLDVALIAIWVLGYGLLMLLGAILRAYDCIGLGTLVEVTLFRVGLLVGLLALMLLEIRSVSAVIMLSAGVTSGAVAFAVVAVVWQARRRCRVRLLNQTSTLPLQEPMRLRGVLAVGLPLLATALLYKLMTDGSMLIVKHTSDVNSLAVYGAALRMWFIFCLPQMAVSIAIQSRIPALHNSGDKAGLEELMRSSGTLAFWPTLAGTIVTLFAGGPLLGLFYGPLFADGALVLSIFCVAQLLCSVVGSSEYLMGMAGGQLKVMLSAVYSTLLAIALGLLLTLCVGPAGAAFAAGLATVFFRLYLAWVCWRQLGVRTYIRLGRAKKEDVRRPLVSPMESGVCA